MVPPLPPAGGAQAGQFPSPNKPKSSLGIHQWLGKTEQHLVNAFNTHALADGQFLASSWSHRCTWHDNVKQYQNVHTNFQKKVGATRQLRELLDDRVKAVGEEIQIAEQNLIKLQHALAEKERPLQLCAWRMEQRSQRPEDEMVRDAFEISLETERETLLRAQEGIRAHCEKTEEAVRKLTQCQKELEDDGHHKSHSLAIDETCLNAKHGKWPTRGTPRMDRSMMAATDAGLRDHVMRSMAAATIEARRRPLPLESSQASKDSMNAAAQGISEEEARQTNTMINVSRTREAEQTTAYLREMNDRLLRITAMDCQAANQAVERAMAQRIGEATMVKKRLETAIKETSEKIEMVAQGMAKTGAHLQADTEPRNICKARDKYRINRTDRENICDPVTAAMGQHIDHLDRNIDFLKQCEGDEIETLEALEATRRELELDLRNKVAALEIDLRCQRFGALQAPSIPPSSKPTSSRNARRQSMKTSQKR
eukprot:gnl/MRDRNA2_/MRDRNA2_62333_c0_seq2.p1 gnl/MRDRNA2_/MRDRNA2_62333_c0~~gnl/MRDRNA2_/MRDRNA2_62333_c0_seq2.p1  ORF type:complete len:483 (-),score=106.58 gnl/MRDRNA2_/MRDRNA2_62333_c0_seq2:112-1560(-)